VVGDPQFANPSKGDLIQWLNGEKVRTVADLKQAVNEVKDGKLEFKVSRGQGEETVPMKVKNVKF
jgi:S1-C subfamily serine protease